jgi:hypothetical protein
LQSYLYTHTMSFFGKIFGKSEKGAPVTTGKKLTNFLP